MNYSLAAQQLPVTPIEDLFGDCGLVVIAPHPDDETLGCGGILAWAARRDVLRHVVFLTNGEQSHPGASQDVTSIRRHEAITASAHLGLAPTQLSFLGLPDSGLLALAADARQWTVHWLRCLAAERPPCVFLVTAPTDAHGDHRAAFSLARDATRDVKGLRLMTYPVWSWLLAEVPAPLNGVRIDIGEYRGAKTRALRAYASQQGRGLLDASGFTLPQELLSHVNNDTEVLLQPDV